MCFERTTILNRAVTADCLKASEVDKGHGRIEVHHVTVSREIDWLKKRHPQWPNLSSVIAIRSIRHQGEQRQGETRYFISSLACTAVQALKAIRSHWAIENQLHWVLDRILVKMPVGFAKTMPPPMSPLSVTWR